MRLNFLHLSFSGLALLMLYMLTAGAAGAYSGPHPGSNLNNVRAVPRNSVPVHLTTSALNTSSIGTHYLYVDDGTNPDSIDVYQTGATMNHVGNYPTGGIVSTTYIGSSNIAVTTGCLIYGDGNGFVDSYPLNSNGSLGTQVSHIAISGAPSDIHIKKGTVYVNVPTVEIASYSLGSGCTLASESSVATSSYFITNFGIAGDELLAPDQDTNTIATYMLGSGGTITALNAETGQIFSPNGVAVQQLSNDSFQVYTGQVAYGPPQAQGGELNTAIGAITFLKGSPASDPGGIGGAGVTFDTTHHILIQGEQFSRTLANYTVVNGTIRFLNETPMAGNFEEPLNFAQLNATLFVITGYNGVVEACTLTPTGATGCKIFATITNRSGFEAGIALL